MTVEQLFGKVREKLGDVEESGGGNFTDDLIRPFYEEAYRKLWATRRNLGLPDIRKDVYYNLPARQHLITPSVHLGVTDFGRPEFVWERGNLTTATVTAASAATPIQITATGHPFSDGDEIFISNVGENANGRWFFSKNDANTGFLNGSSSSTAYSGVSGTATRSDEDFLRLRGPVDVLSQSGPHQLLGEYQWKSGRILTPGSTEIRQVWIEYLANGTPPSSGEIGISAAESFLVSYTAALSAPTGGQHTRYRELMVEALGRPDVPGYGGLLLEYVRDPVKQMHARSYAPRLRGRRRYAT